MQTEPQQDNKLVTLATNAQLQGQQMSQQIADARRLLYDAYAQVASGEGSLATLQETLFAFDTQIELIQRTGEINTEIVKMVGQLVRGAARLAKRRCDLPGRTPALVAGAEGIPEWRP